MKIKACIIWWFSAGVVFASTADKNDLILNDGRVLKAARIIMIGEHVSIIHANGATTVPADLVPLDSLARAHLDLQAKTAERKKQVDELTAKAAERIAAKEAQKQKEVQIRLAAANVRAAALGDDQVTIPGANSRPDAAQRLIVLKGKFPAKHTVKFETRWERKKFDLDVPHMDQWSYYKGTIQSATMESLPKALEQIEARMQLDIQAANKRVSDLRTASTRQTERAQSMHTLNWLQQDLRPYLAQLRALL